MMSPYDLMDIYIPLDSLFPEVSYWIKASFEGGHAIEPIMRRKPLFEQQLDTDSDFMVRFG